MRILLVLPTFLSGTFALRILGESFALLTLTGLFWPLIAIALLLILATSWYLADKQRPFAFHIPPAFLLLSPYLFWPYIDWVVAGSCLLAVIFYTLAQRVRLNNRIALLILSLGSFGLYVATLAPDILPADNGEFQLIATNLGVAHPTGYPLYTILAHLSTWLPLSATPAYKINLFSALTSTGTLILLYLCLQKLAPEARERSWIGIATAVSLATATTFWSQATTANVRSLTAFFATLTFYTLIRFYQAQEQIDRDRWLMWATLSIGSGIIHHVSLLFIGLICGLFVLWVDWHVLHPKRIWPSLFMIPLATLPWLYLPLRAGADRAPESLATWDGFWNHVLARGFSGDFFYFVNPADLWERTKIMGNVLQFQFHPFLLFGMALGLVWLLRQDQKLAFLLGGSFLLHTFITATYRAPQTVEYMLPAYIPLVLALGYGLSQWRWSTFLTTLTITIAIWQGWQLWPSYQFLHHTTDTRQTTQILLEEAPLNSTILAHWHWVTPLWYLQEVEGIRPDVVVHYVAPTAEEYPATWARRVREALDAGQNVITTHYDAPFYAGLPIPDPIGEVFLFRQEPLVTLPNEFEPVSIMLNEQIEIIGIQLPKTAVSGQTHTATIAWQWTTSPPNNASLFAHLVGFDGQIYAQDDSAIANTDGIHLTQFHLTPRLGALPGVFNLMVGIHDTREQVGAYQVRGLPIATNRIFYSPAQLSDVNFTALESVPITRNRTFHMDPRLQHVLLGYDWDTTFSPARLYLHWQTETGLITTVQGEGYTLPETIGAWGVLNAPQTLPVEQTHYVPFPNGLVWTGPHLTQTSYPTGANLLVWQQFRSNQPQLRDMATSVRLVGYAEDGFTWAWADLDEGFGIPAMGAIPTLKWVGGTAVYDPHQHTVPSDAPAGQSLGVIFNLYDTFTNRPLPPLDERLQPATTWDTATTN